LAIQITPGMIVEHLPCSSCTAMCCGPVPITESRLEKIRDYLHTMTAEERKRLANQQRDYLTCGFLDVETHLCTIYPVRPWVCEAFGRVSGLECPKVDRLVQIIPDIISDAKLAQESATPTVASSDDWNWRRMSFE
jgi:uncharacterized protein